ncbi:acyltransferase [Actinomadura darangshiensis]|uniref:Acyltransferase n=1 Tax=Actinomadura darangshiensis TaxID=705336 RepID=A0A4R5AMK3_9ACTN|nr:acyltransferase family protein [Actinomadura darangshiensis]TDD73215.1 acyltransferase [Actinomadura darangshiensis]
MTQTPETSVVAEATAEPSTVRPVQARPQQTGPSQGGTASGGTASGGPASAGAAPGAPARKPRDPHLDNAKYLAILLVAAGHGLSGLRDVPFAATVWNFIYMFHMPLFVMVSGYLSKRFQLSDDKVARLAGSTLVPYLIFQCAYSLFAWGVDDRRFQFDVLDPYYLTWFLLALFVWRLLTPVLRRLKYPLATAVLVCLLMYMTDVGSTLDIYRILGLLPFYVLGLTLSPEVIQIVRRPAVRIAGAAVLAAGFGLSFLTHDHMNARWLNWDASNADLGVDELTGTLMRMALLGTAIVLLLAFLAVVPSRRTWYSELGTATLYGYLLHGFLMRLFTFEGWHAFGWFDTIPGVLSMVLAGFVVVTLLCTAPVRRVTRWAVEPDMRALFSGK